MIGKKSISVLLLTCFALAVLYNYSTQLADTEEVSDIDLNCGFSSDFADFLRKSIIRSIKIMHPTVSKEAISSVLPMEENRAQNKNQQKPLL